EKWIEELAEALGRDAGAGIRDLHDDRALARGELELHRAAARRRLVGVHEEVDEERLQLTLVAEDEARDRSGRDPERQLFLLEGRLEELDRFAQRLADVEAVLGRTGGPREPAEALDEPLHALDLARDDPAEVLEERMVVEPAWVNVLMATTGFLISWAMLEARTSK